MLFRSRLILVDGQLRIEKYQKDGEQKTAVKVVANQVRFMETKKNAGNGELTDEEAFGKYEPGSTLRDLEVPDDDTVPF